MLNPHPPARQCRAAGWRTHRRRGAPRCGWHPPAPSALRQRAHALQQFVAAMVSLRVVDRLEPVEINAARNAGRAARASSRRKWSRSIMRFGRPVSESWLAMCWRRISAWPPVGDVDRGGEDADDLARPVAERCLAGEIDALLARGSISSSRAGSARPVFNTSWSSRRLIWPRSSPRESPRLAGRPEPTATGRQRRPDGH